MVLDIHLLFHFIAGGFSCGAILLVAFFTLKRARNADAVVPLAILLILTLVAQIAYVVGVALTDPSLAYKLQMLDVVIALISATTIHCAYAVVGKARAAKRSIVATYALSIAFIVASIADPSLFIGPTEPKMYFPNYFTPGTLFLAFTVVFKVMIPAWAVVVLARAAKDVPDAVRRKRYIYFALSFILGWMFAITSTLLAWDIPLDPSSGNLLGVLFAVPVIYAVLRYGLFDVRVLAKRALLYAGAVIAIGFVLEFVDIMSHWFAVVIPGFPEWAIPFALSVGIVTVGFLVWRQLKESEVLKYEFVTTVTHKFRTPLTHIKWAIENMKSMPLGEDASEQLRYAEEASEKLVELTGVLANVSESEEDYRYRIDANDLSAAVKAQTDAISGAAHAKSVIVVTAIEPDVYAKYDPARLGFVIQTIFDNAVTYTPPGGAIEVRVRRDGREAVCSVKDSGIGIPKHELSRVAEKLYRGARARSTDTEGMGIGLYTSKEILARQGGRLSIESEGEGKGTTATFYLPAAKKAKA